MTDKRFRVGVAVSGLWLVFTTLMLIFGTWPTALNEWGDFFAGFFAPLAFFWLVLGYLQQGDELRQSSEALRLQAEELRNSVEQQSQLVSVSREQLQHEKALLQEQREQQREAIRPRFMPTFSGSSSSGSLETTTYNLEVHNHGAFASNTVCSFAPGIRNFTEQHIGIVQTHNGFTLKLQFDALRASTTLRISFVDGAGNEGADSFTIVAGEPSLGTLKIGSAVRLV